MDFWKSGIQNIHHSDAQFLLLTGQVNNRQIVHYSDHHLDNWTLGDRITFNHMNTIRYSDLHCVSGFQIRWFAITNVLQDIMWDPCIYLCQRNKQLKLKIYQEDVDESLALPKGNLLPKNDFFYLK